MKKIDKKLNALSLVSNLAIFVATFYSVLKFYIGVGFGNMMVHGPSCFRFFTVDSNILVAVGSLVMLTYNIRRFNNPDIAIPNGLRLFKFAGTVAVTVTLITVLAFLGPTTGYDIMFEGPCLFMHLLTPLAAILTFSVFEADGKFSMKQALIGVIPTAVYGVVYLILVVKIGKDNGGWNDFYGFNSGMLEGKWYISMIAMLGFTYLFSLGIGAIHSAVTKKKENK